jgi:hypothetical protein
MKLVVAGLMSALVISPVAARASCAQADLAGSWKFYRNQGKEWERCNFVVKNGGVFEPGGSCSFSFDATPMQISKGLAKLTSPADCTFTARFAVDGHVTEIVDATLSYDKHTAAGVGNQSISEFIFTMLKM